MRNDAQHGIPDAVRSVRLRSVADVEGAYGILTLDADYPDWLPEHNLVDLTLPLPRWGRG